MSSIDQFARELHSQDPTATPNEIAAQVVEAIVQSGELETLLPLVYPRVVIALRSDARAAENAVRDVLDPAQDGAHEHLVNPVALRQQQCAQMFAIQYDDDRPTRYVTWAESTVQDHEDRIAMLRRKVDGIEATIQLHAEAIEIMERYGAKTYGEVVNVAA